MQAKDVESMQELARQLRTPHGSNGTQVAASMHASNIGMTRACFTSLQVEDGRHVLEIGHGAGAHVAELFEMQPGMTYQGLELSELMHREAVANNQSQVAKGTAQFSLYEGEIFPFADACFHRTMSVNTLYFLPEPSGFLDEVYRTLRPSGAFAVAFAARDFMRTLSFAQYGFQLYTTEEVERLLHAAGFRTVKTEIHSELIASKEGPGETVHRDFVVVRANKPAD